MKKVDLKILLPVCGLLLLVTSILALQGVLAGIGLGIAGMLIFGPNVEQIKGKTGGIVYVTGKTGPYTRARVPARNPKTTLQEANRNAHARLMRAWKTEAVDKVAFNNYAASHPVPNRMGRMSCISGINWFVKINRIAQKADSTCGLITKPPSTDTALPVLTGVNVTTNFEQQSVVIEPSAIGNYTPDMRLDVWATMQMSAGVFSTKNFRSLGVYNPALSNTIDISADYIERFGALRSGEKLFVKVRIITTIGESSQFVSKGAGIRQVL